MNARRGNNDNRVIFGDGSRYKTVRQRQEFDEAEYVPGGGRGAKVVKKKKNRAVNQDRVGKKRERGEDGGVVVGREMKIRKLEHVDVEVIDIKKVGVGVEFIDVEN